MNLKLITFKTNHTIMCELECINDTEILMKQPVQVIMQPTKDGPMMGFGPFLEYCDEFKTGIKISMNDVLCIVTPITELVNQYSQVFGSGITIASTIPKV
jgi:hypothetical protein